MTGIRSKKLNTKLTTINVITSLRFDFIRCKWLKAFPPFPSHSSTELAYYEYIMALSSLDGYSFCYVFGHRFFKLRCVPLIFRYLIMGYFNFG